MKPLKEYRIPFTGLKMGKHEFHFEINDAFFAEFEYSLVKSGNLKADLELDKQETLLILNFNIQGQLNFSCDVCLADYPSNISIEERQIVKFSGDENLEDNTDEIVVLTKNDFEIDVSKLIYEYITLSVPYINRCDDEGNTQWCDKEMIAKLDELSGENEQETDNDDPRWEALKNIKK
ncbi:YceD family protein [Daejeonella oryzae]|uniref:YceD family protein n=1 Tax=Daejeonella oryzae TaxID=1122943 RepID=UPI00047A5EF4|nr:DUF177 domain-containing protein [Daejeonella oryzae]